jgi:DNA-binding FrmR family transcriptional regulator
MGGDRIFVMGAHTENKTILARLKRVNGHLAKVIEMIGSDEEHLTIAQQLQAVESAVANAKKTYIHDHIEHCLADAKDDRNFGEKLKEFKEISKYL